LLLLVIFLELYWSGSECCSKFVSMSSMVKTVVSSACSQSSRIVGNTAQKTVIPKIAKAAPSIPSNNALLKAQSHLQGRPSTSCNVMTGSMSVRYAHSDLQVPDFTDYKITPSQGRENFHERERERKIERKSFYYTVTAGIGVGGVYTAKSVVDGLIRYIGPSRDVLAMGATEVPMGSIPEGKSMTFEWRGKPLFIRHRTAEEIDREAAVDVSSLRDPETDLERVQQAEWLVVIGVCTHLGCVPIADAGDFGGYYCPCHGSHYDGSGRIRKGPAPRNLEVPNYSIVDDEIIKVG